MEGTFLQLIEAILPMIEAAALSIGRPLGFLVVFPVFGWLGLQGMIRNTVALVIGFPLIGGLYLDLASSTGSLPTEYVAVLAAKEFLIGAVMGMIFGMPFWAAETAGAYVDNYRGSVISTVASPDNMSEPLVTGALFTLLLVMIFFIIGGMRLVIGALYESYGIWPVSEPVPRLSEPLYPIVRELLGKIFQIGLALGAPIMIAMFLGEMALAFSSRFAQQVNIFDTTLSVKNLIFLFMMPPYMYLLATIYGPDLLDIPGLMEIMTRMVTPE